MNHTSAKAELNNGCIDNAVVQVQACAAGVTAGKATAETLGRSRSGFGYKIHVLTNALGSPVHFILTVGQAASTT